MHEHERPNGESFARSIFERCRCLVYMSPFLLLDHTSIVFISERGLRCLPAKKERPRTQQKRGLCSERKAYLRGVHFLGDLPSNVEKNQIDGVRYLVPLTNPPTLKVKGKRYILLSLIWSKIQRKKQIARHQKRLIRSPEQLFLFYSGDAVLSDGNWKKSFYLSFSLFVSVKEREQADLLGLDRDSGLQVQGWRWDEGNPRGAWRRKVEWMAERILCVSLFFESQRRLRAKGGLAVSQLLCANAKFEVANLPAGQTWTA